MASLMKTPSIFPPKKQQQERRGDASVIRTLVHQTGVIFFFQHILIFNLNIFRKLRMCLKENEVCLIHGWKSCMYYTIDTERNVMLNSFMADMPKAIQMRELITMQAQEISY